MTVQPSGPAAADPPVAPLVTKIQKFYDSTRDLRARFDQALETGTGAKKKASGQLWLKKPGKMRWDYSAPEHKLMLSDGQTLWVYEPDDAQAFRQDLRSSTLPLSVSFLFGQGKLTDEFTVAVAHETGVGQMGDVVLKLVPKTATTAYRYLLFVVDPKTGLVRETIIFQDNGATNHLSFSNVEINRGMDEAKFKFVAPPGTKVLSPGQAAP